MQGVSLRVQENNYHVALWRSFGANPTPLATTELYISLQQGVIDGQENPYEVIIAQKLYEQQDYIIYTNHLLQVCNWVMNLDQYESLSDEALAVLTDACVEAQAAAEVHLAQTDADNLAFMLDYGMEEIFLDDSVLAELQEYAKTVWPEIKEVTGTDIYDSYMAASGIA